MEQSLHMSLGNKVLSHLDVSTKYFNKYVRDAVYYVSMYMGNKHSFVKYTKTLFSSCFESRLVNNNCYFYFSEERDSS